MKWYDVVTVLAAALISFLLYGTKLGGILAALSIVLLLFAAALLSVQLARSVLKHYRDR